MAMKTDAEHLESIKRIEQGYYRHVGKTDQELDESFPLVELATIAQKRGNTGRIVASILDLKFTHQFACDDFMRSGVAYNEARQAKAANPDDPSAEIAKRIEMLNHSQSFALRIRAFWDKYMGLLVLLLNAEVYERFLSAPTRQGFFRENFALLLNPEFFTLIMRVVDVANEVRTPEAHHAGALRKFILGEEELKATPDSPYFNLLGLHNNALDSCKLLTKSLLEGHL